MFQYYLLLGSDKRIWDKIDDSQIEALIKYFKLRTQKLEYEYRRNCHVFSYSKPFHREWYFIFHNAKKYYRENFKLLLQVKQNMLKRMQKDWEEIQRNPHQISILAETYNILYSVEKELFR